MSLLYSTVQHCNLRHSTDCIVVCWWAVLYCTVLHYTVLHCTLQTVPYHTVLCCAVRYCTAHDGREGRKSLACRAPTRSVEAVEEDEDMEGNEAQHGAQYSDVFMEGLRRQGQGISCVVQGVVDREGGVVVPEVRVAQPLSEGRRWKGVAPHHDG